MVERDNDDNLLHDSDPEGSDGIFGFLSKYGRDQDKHLWSLIGNQADTTFDGNGEPSAIAGLASDLTGHPQARRPRSFPPVQA